MTAEALQAYLDRVVGEKSYDQNYTQDRIFHAPVLEHEHRRQIIEDVKTHTGPGRVHLGVAGFFNFDVIVAGGHDACVLIDRSGAQIAFWKQVFRWIEDSENLMQLRENFTRHADRYFMDMGSSQSNVPLVGMTYENFIGDCRWAFDEQAYQHVRRMVLDKKVATLQVDALDEPRCKAISHALKTYDTETGTSLRIDTVYGSNILEIGGPRMSSLTLSDIFRFLEREYLRLPADAPQDTARNTLAASLVRQEDVGDRVTPEQAMALADAAIAVVQNAQQKEITAFVARAAERLVNAVGEETIQRALTEDLLAQGGRFRIANRTQARAAVATAREELARNPEAADAPHWGDADFRGQMLGREMEAILRKHLTLEDYNHLGLAFRDEQMHMRGFTALADDDDATIYLARMTEFREPVTKVAGGKVSERFRADSPLNPEPMVGL